MTPKLMVALLAPLLLGGCMKAGMAGMSGMGHMTAGAHGDSPAAARDEPTVVKEVMSGGLRVTVDFPPYAPVDSLRYAVTVRRLDGQFITTDALVFLEVSPATTESVVTSPTPTHAAHQAQAAKTIPGSLERMRLAPVERGGGRFVFRPSIPRGGAYRLVVVVERVGETTLEPPIVVEHVVALTASVLTASESAHVMLSGGKTALVLLGGVSMAVMMLFAMR